MRKARIGIKETQKIIRKLHNRNKWLNNRKSFAYQIEDDGSITTLHTKLRWGKPAPTAHKDFLEAMAKIRSIMTN